MKCDSRQHDLRRERQRRHRRPRRDGAVVRPVREAARLVVVEATLDAIDPVRGGTGAVARGDPPAVFAVSLEVVRVADRILLLHQGRTAAVLEVVDAPLAHEGVLDAPKVNPDVRQLMDEERSGIQEFMAVELPSSDTSGSTLRSSLPGADGSAIPGPARTGESPRYTLPTGTGRNPPSGFHPCVTVRPPFCAHCQSTRR